MRFPESFSALLLALILGGAAPVARAADQLVDSPDKDYSAELPRIAPLSPEEALREFEIVDGFEIELVACEPLVSDPVAFAFDARGRLWVVEMRDYSEQDTERLGRVALLTDTDGDGVMDQRSTFAENLSWPTAIWPWRDGVLVAEPPHLTWYRDTDGDGVSDRSDVWYTGFSRSNVQGMVNSLRWGVDGWIHGATSSSGARLESPIGAAPIDLGRRDFAIDPITGALRAESGGGQHGMSFNRWGDKFVTSNSDHLQQIIDLEGWLADHPAPVPLPAVRRSIAEDGPQAEVFRASPVEPWRIVRTRLRVSGVAPGAVEGGGRAAGYFTGATGTWIMDRERGFGYPTESVTDGPDIALVCDVGSNLVHRKRLIDQGLFWSAQRIDQQSELLRSRDIWFRPVQLGDGPDGALYIADMYREVIEHPLSLPPMIKKHLDLTSGRDRGRIWRLASPHTPRLASEDLTQLDNAALVQRLSSAIAWQRLMASQMLLERRSLGLLNAQVGELLQASALDAARPESRLLSLWLLARMELWPADFTARALQEPHPRVLAHAIDLMSLTGQAGELADRLAELATDCSDARVQLALAKLATQLSGSDKTRVLAGLLPHAQQPLVRAAVATAADQDSWQLFTASAAEAMNDASYSNWLSLFLPGWLSSAAASPELVEFMSRALQPQQPRQKLWLTALAALPAQPRVARLLHDLQLQSVIDQQIDQLLQQAPSHQVARWLGLVSPELQTRWMDELIHSSVAEPLQVACIEALSWANHPELAGRLVDQFRSFTPALQQLALRTLVVRPERAAVLADALQSQQVARSQIPPDMRQSLLGLADKQLAGRFQQLLSPVSSDRAAVIERYRTVWESPTVDPADAQAGQLVFERACAQCHRLGDIGQDVGPPLRQLADKSPLQLLEAILDPSLEVDPKYAAYSILTEDGLVLTGLIVQESGNQVVIAEAGGKQTTLDRGAIEQINSSGLSLMPNGLEEQITPRQMLDLIEYLQHPR